MAILSNGKIQYNKIKTMHCISQLYLLSNNIVTFSFLADLTKTMGTYLNCKKKLLFASDYTCDGHNLKHEY